MGSVQCGTASGYTTHYQRGEKPCAACKAAKAEAKAAAKHRRERLAKLAEIERIAAELAAPIEHGSPADYIAHKKAGEEPCQTCKDHWESYRFKNDYDPVSWERMPRNVYR